MSFKLTVGRVAVAGTELFTNEAIAAFHCDHTVVSPGWLVHVLPGAAAKVVTDTAVKGATLNKPKLREIPLDLPPLPEQRRIAEILDTLDEAIRKTEQVIAKLQQVKQGLLHDLLTRGLDDNGELRDPDRHPEQFKDSPLGRIPRGWEVVRGAEICHRVEVGIVIRPTQYYSTKGVPVLRSANVREGKVELSDLKFMADRDHALLSKSAVTPGDLVTVRTGYPGTTAVIPPALEQANCVDIIISRPGPRVLPHYLATWVNSDMGKGQVLRVQGGLAQQHFNVGEMKKLLVALPGMDEQARLVATVAAADKRLQDEMGERDKLSTLMKGLMDDLLTGRVRVKVPEESV